MSSRDVQYCENCKQDHVFKGPKCTHCGEPIPERLLTQLRPNVEDPNDSAASRRAVEAARRDFKRAKRNNHERRDLGHFVATPGFSRS